MDEGRLDVCVVVLRGKEVSPAWLQDIVQLVPAVVLLLLLSQQLLLMIVLLHSPIKRT